MLLPPIIKFERNKTKNVTVSETQASISILMK